MKREIKFRAYSPLDRKVYPVSNIEWDSDGSLWVTADDGKNGIELIDDEAHLMEYTGLHDTEGREIYEGDIIQVTADDGSAYIAPVIYGLDYDYPAFDLDGRYIPDAWFYPANTLSTLVANGDDATFKVIGNCWKNPELLEAAK